EIYDMRVIGVTVSRSAIQHEAIRVFLDQLQYGGVIGVFGNVLRVRDPRYLPQFLCKEIGFFASPSVLHVEPQGRTQLLHFSTARLGEVPCVRQPPAFTPAVSLKVRTS